MIKFDKDKTKCILIAVYFFFPPSDKYLHINLTKQHKQYHIKLV